MLFRPLIQSFHRPLSLLNRTANDLLQDIAIWQKLDNMAILHTQGKRSLQVDIIFIFEFVFCTFLFLLLFIRFFFRLLLWWLFTTSWCFLHRFFFHLFLFLDFFVFIFKFFQDILFLFLSHDIVFLHFDQNNSFILESSPYLCICLIVNYSFRFKILLGIRLSYSKDQFFFKYFERSLNLDSG